MHPKDNRLTGCSRLCLLLFKSALPSLCIAVACGGCLYFNLFYNAQTSFDTSLKAHQKLIKDNPDTVLTLPQDVENGYKKTIDKCLKVFELYPTKKQWHDKALFLMGKAEYYLGDFDKAIRTFAQLQREFPASPLVPESYVFTGRAQLKKGNLEEAEKTFTSVLERYPELNRNQDVSMLMAEIVIRREGKSQAVVMLEKIYKNARTNDRKMELAIKIAQLYRDLKLYDKAIGFLRGSPRVKDLTDQLYRIDFLLVACLADKGDLGRALDLVNVLILNKVYYSRVPLLQFQKGGILDKLNRTDEAIATYKQVTESPLGGDAVGLAWFELAVIYQMKKGNLKKAKECFDKAAGSLKDPDEKDIATRRSKAIDIILKFADGKMPVDSVKVDVASSADFKVGELFWLELDEPDSAYRHYCKTMADTQFRALAPKSLYAAAWIARYSLKDTAKADSLYRLLLRRFPANIYAQKAQAARGDKITIFTRQDSARSAFEAAEQIFLDNDNPDSAAEAYVEVYKEFPGSDFGPKSLYAAAWIYDNVLDKNRTAKGLYETLCDSFPKSSFCVNEAKPRLKVVADSMAALRARRRAAATAPQAGRATQNPALALQKPLDTAQTLLTDKDSSAARKSRLPSQADGQGAGPGPYGGGPMRGMYRGAMTPQMTPQAQPSAPAQAAPVPAPSPITQPSAPAQSAQPAALSPTVLPSAPAQAPRAPASSPIVQPPAPAQAAQPSDSVISVKPAPQPLLPAAPSGNPAAAQPQASPSPDSTVPKPR
jgi:TolA-binding protein